VTTFVLLAIKNAQKIFFCWESYLKPHIPIGSDGILLHQSHRSKLPPTDRNSPRPAVRLPEPYIVHASTILGHADTSPESHIAVS